jgi:hypothetical protein
MCKSGALASNLTWTQLKPAGARFPDRSIHTGPSIPAGFVSASPEGVAPVREKTVLCEERAERAIIFGMAVCIRPEVMPMRSYGEMETSRAEF